MRDPLKDVDGEVRIVEVGPRDGLQNEARIYPTEVKQRFIEALFVAGLSDVEITSFVRPDRVPQLADADQLFPRVVRADRRCLALVLNERGFERARAAGATAVGMVVAASEGFSRANSGRSNAESLTALTAIIEAARTSGVWLRGYVSTCFRCPYDGPVPPAQAIATVCAVVRSGVDEVVVSDTLGDADPRQIVEVCGPLIGQIGTCSLALHLHDTSGLAMANLLVSLQLGVRTFDGSVGGLGGCPFAPGARGNVATEMIVRLCEHLGLRTGVGEEKLAVARQVLSNAGTV